jgi:hypothetical protein
MFLRSNWLIGPALSSNGWMAEKQMIKLDKGLITFPRKRKDRGFAFTSASKATL